MLPPGYHEQLTRQQKLHEDSEKLSEVKQALIKVLSENPQGLSLAQIP